MIPKLCSYAGIASPHDIDIGLFPGRSQNFFMCFLRKINHNHQILLTSASDEKQVFMSEDAQASHRGLEVSDSSTLSLLQTGADVQFDCFSIYDPTGTKKCMF